MPNFLLLIPSIILYIVVFLNICKYKFSAIEIFAGAFFSYVMVMIVITQVAYVTIPVLNADTLGNLTFIICLAIFTWCKTKNTLLSGYYASLTVVTTMIGNTIVSIFVEYLFSVSIKDARDSLLLLFITIIPTFFICYTISKYIGNRLHQSYIRLSYETKQKYVMYGLVLSVLTYLLSHVNILVYRVVDDTVLLSTINTTIITFFFFVAIIMMSAYSLSQQKQIEAEYKHKAQEDLEAYTKQLENAYEEMRCFRHDHFNFIHTLMGYVNDESPDELKKRLARTLSYTEKALEKLDYSMDRLKNINLPELKGLLSMKFALALSRDIVVELDIANQIDNIHVNRTDLCRIIGIIVDNALEELLSIEYGRKILKFGIIADGTETLIICTNTCVTVPIIERIFMKGFTTKEEGRGLGLYNLKQICKECGNLMVTAHTEDNNFTIIVTIRQV